MTFPIHPHNLVQPYLAVRSFRYLQLSLKTFLRYFYISLYIFLLTFQLSISAWSCYPYFWIFLFMYTGLGRCRPFIVLGSAPSPTPVMMQHHPWGFPSPIRGLQRLYSVYFTDLLTVGAFLFHHTQKRIFQFYL